MDITHATELQRSIWNKNGEKISLKICLFQKKKYLCPRIEVENEF